MRILVCGDRHWQNRLAIQRELVRLRKILGQTQYTIIEGEAKGADTLARKVAESLGWSVMRFFAEWDRFGKAAGPIRNRRMLDEGKPDLVIAFHANIERSRGTKDMVEQAKKRGIETKVIKA